MAGPCRRSPGQSASAQGVLVSGAGTPPKIKALVTDFDGVHTDNSVFVDHTGRELVQCSRADGMGIEFLRNRGVRCLVLSRESDGCVAARARKLQMECLHDVRDKLPVLDQWRIDNGLSWPEIAYIGDDVNDLDCLRVCGFAAAPANARPEVKTVADLNLSCTGGQGAIRELCDFLLTQDLVADGSI